jgi:hypothetical protein
MLEPIERAEGDCRMVNGHRWPGGDERIRVWCNNGKGWVVMAFLAGIGVKWRVGSSWVRRRWLWIASVEVFFMPDELWHWRMIVMRAAWDAD